MSKKASKQLQNTIRKPRLVNSISFDRISFYLGRARIVTNSLANDLNKQLIEYYRQKRFDKELYHEAPSLYFKNHIKKCMILLEKEALAIVREIQLKPYGQLIKITPERYQQFLQKNQYQYEQDLQKIQFNHCNYLAQIRTDIYKTVKQQKPQSIEMNRSIRNDYIKTIIEQSCINLEKQLLIQSIVMVIQRYPLTFSAQSQQKLQTITSICIFEQCYPAKEFTKLQLLKLIGNKAYELKVRASLKIYHESLFNQKFYNPSFLVCHDCIKVILNIQFFQSHLSCTRNIEEQRGTSVCSPFAFTPLSYMFKMILKQHFLTRDESFSHPFITYFIRGKKDGTLVCNRKWCGICIVDNKPSMKSDYCDFCDMRCNCKRCLKFQKLLQMLAFYIFYGGKQEQIKKKFLWIELFKDKDTKFENFKNTFDYKTELSKMYQKYGEIEKYTNTTQWKKPLISDLISGLQPSSKAENDLVNQWWNKDRMKPKRKISKQQIINRKKNLKRFQKQKMLDNTQNIDRKISSLSEDIKKQLISAEKQQRMLFKDKLLKSKILKIKSSQSSRYETKNRNAVIIQKSPLNKKERLLFEKLNIFVMSQSKRNLQGNEQSASLKELKLKINKQSEKIVRQQKNQEKMASVGSSQNYPSIWQ